MSIDKIILFILYLISFVIVLFFPMGTLLYKLAILYSYILTAFLIGYLIGRLAGHIILRIKK
jgi:hypothetical protein